MTAVPSSASMAAASRASGRVPRPTDGADPLVMAIDVGAQRLSAGLVSTQGHVIVRDRVATPRDVWPALERLVRRVVAARPSERSSTLRCGVTCEAPLDAAPGKVSPLTMPLLKGFDLRDRLAELTGLDVVLETRGNGRALAERWQGGHDPRDAAHLIVVIASESVDGGVIVDGQVVHGRTGNAGNLAHVIVEPEDGLECLCGSFGCLAPYLSTRSLEIEINRPLRRAQPSIIERTGVMLGRAIATAVASFDTRLVLIGGATPAALGPPLLDVTRRELAQRSRLSHLSELRVEPVALGLEGTLLGAAASALGHPRTVSR
jgi:glucokinase